MRFDVPPKGDSAETENYGLYHLLSFRGMELSLNSIRDHDVERFEERKAFVKRQFLVYSRNMVSCYRLFSARPILQWQERSEAMYC